MPTKHLYVSEDDATLWEEAEIVALAEHRSVSWVVHDALRVYLATKAIAAIRRLPGGRDATS